MKVLTEETEDIFESKNYDEFLYEDEHKVGELAYLYDCFNGEYFIVGIPLQMKLKAEDRWDYFEFNSISTQYVDYVRRVAKHVEEKFNEHVEYKKANSFSRIGFFITLH